MSVTKLLDEFEAELAKVVEQREKAAGVRKLLAQVEKLGEVELPEGLKLTLPTDKQVQAAQEWLDSASGSTAAEMAPKVEAIPTLGEGFATSAEVERAQALLERFGEVGKRRGRGASRTGTRALSHEVGFVCGGCGMKRNSPTGDWGSIRHQAKTHAEECEHASISGDDLDKAREAVKTKDVELQLGGLTFFTK